MFHFLEFMCLWKTGTYRIALLLYYFKLGTIMGVLSMCLVVGLGKGRPGRKLAFSTIKGWSVLPDRDRIGRLSLCLFIDYKNFISLEMNYKIPQPHKAPPPLSFCNVILVSRLLKSIAVVFSIQLPLPVFISHVG